MQLVYLLETTELCGGVRVVFDQARALIARGHQVTLLALRGDSQWYPHPVNVTYIKQFNDFQTAVDVCIATYWTTVHPAMAMNSRLTVHFCQGCEWLFPELAAMKSDIINTYAQPIAKLVLGRWLQDAIETDIQPHDFAIACIGQSVDQQLYRLTYWEKIRARFQVRNQRTKILLVGLYESAVKGIRPALQAIETLRQRGFELEVLRVSTWPLSSAESQITQIDAYYQAISPQHMRDIYQQADLFIASSEAAEGFGLPFAEALSMGVACIATRIPSYLSFDAAQDFAYFVAVNDVDAIVEGIETLIQQPKQRQRLRRAGFKVAQQFQAKQVALRIEQHLQHWLTA